MYHLAKCTLLERQEQLSVRGAAGVVTAVITSTNGKKGAFTVTYFTPPTPTLSSPLPPLPLHLFTPPTSSLSGVICPIAYATLKLGIVLLTEGNTKIQSVSILGNH